MPDRIKRFLRTMLLAVAIILLLAIILFARRIFFKQQPSEKHPNILLILMDAARPDHLGCYGYNKNASPNIDAVALQGALFTDCYTVASWTNPVLVSLFTGLYPQSVLPPQRWAMAYKHKLPPDIATLAGILRDNGYRTAALVDHVGLGKQLEYSRGFENYICNKPPLHYLRSSDLKVLSKQTTRLFKKYENKRFFIYIHLMYSHEPYVTSEQVSATGFSDWLRIKNQDIKNKDKLIEAYDSGIKVNDLVIGDMLDYLKQAGSSDNTYIIIMADHGQGFWEHSFYAHGNSLYNELLRIPLIIYPAGDKRSEGLHIGGVASAIDIFPTILDIAGIRKHRTFDGISLLPYMRSGKNLPHRFVFSESPHSHNINAISCEDGRYKLIYSPIKGPRISYLTMLKDMITAGNCQLYDLSRDPHETVNIAGKERFKTFILGSHIIFHKMKNDRRRSKMHLVDAQFSNGELIRLRALGYMQ